METNSSLSEMQVIKRIIISIIIFFIFVIFVPEMRKKHRKKMSEREWVRRNVSYNAKNPVNRIKT